MEADEIKRTEHRIKRPECCSGPPWSGSQRSPPGAVRDEGLFWIPVYTAHSWASSSAAVSAALDNSQESLIFVLNVSPQTRFVSPTVAGMMNFRWFPLYSAPEKVPGQSRKCICYVYKRKECVYCSPLAFLTGTAVNFNVPIETDQIISHLVSISFPVWLMMCSGGLQDRMWVDMWIPPSGLYSILWRNPLSPLAAQRNPRTHRLWCLSQISLLVLFGGCPTLQLALLPWLGKVVTLVLGSGRPLLNLYS